MITAYIWGAGAGGKVFAFWGWAQREPRLTRAPHIVCGRTAPKTEALKQRYLACQAFEARKAVDATARSKAHLDSVQAAKSCVTGGRAGKPAQSAERSAVNGSGCKGAAKAIGPSKVNNIGQADKLLKATNN